MGRMIPATAIVGAILAAATACTQKVALYCDEDTPCTDPARPYCDLNGQFEASDFISNTCIPDPFGADAGVTPDADPNAPDADPAAPDAAPAPRKALVFYRAPITATDKTGLHLVEIENGIVGPSVELSGPYAGGAVGVSYFAPAPDGTNVVYTSTEGGNGNALYFVDLSGASPGSPVPLAGAAGTGLAAVRRGDTVLYAEDADGNGSKIYYRDLRNGTPSAPTTLGPGLLSALVCCAQLSSLSDDGRHMMFVDLGDSQLYYSYLGGASPTVPLRVNGDLVSGGAVGKFGFAPDGSSLFYLASQENAARIELYSRPISPTGVMGGTTKLNGTLVSGGNVGRGSGSILDDVWYAPNSAYLVYLADQRTDNVTEIFAVDLRGASPGPPVPLNGALPSDGDVLHVVISPNGQRLVYIADQSANDVQELWLVDMSNPAAPTIARRINGVLAAGGDVDAPSAAFSPDSDVVAYLADQDTDEIQELYVVDVSGSLPGAPMKVNGPLVSGGDVHRDSNGFFGSATAVFAGSAALLYRADEDVDGVRELYYADLATSVSAKVHTDFAAGQEIDGANSALVLEGGLAALYLADVAGAFELWHARLDGGFPATPTRVNEALAGGRVSALTVVYQ